MLYALMFNNIACPNLIKEVINYSLIITVFIGISFIFRVLLLDKFKSKTILFLNLVVLFFTLNNLQIVLLDNIYTDANFFQRNLLIPFYSLIVPAFYTFLTHYLRIENRLKSYVLIISSLFFVQIVVRVLLFNYFFDDDKNIVVARYSQIEEIFNALISLFLFITSAIIIFKKKNLFTTISSFDDIKWLKKFIVLGGIIIVTWIIAIVFNVDEVLQPEIFIYYPLRLSSSILLFWLGFQGFFNYSILNERISLRKQVDNDNVEKDILIQKNINLDADFIIIRDYIISNKKHRDSNLSIPDLAKDTNFSSKKLSKLFKDNTNNGFVDYINEMRIEHAKKILTDPNYNNYTHTAIAFECGFNSKSTFYRVFKKIIGKTPTEYKKLIIN